jgi:DNA-binding XRE family transcriptional regulator
MQTGNCDEIIDPNVETICESYRARAKQGLLKYGVTTARSDLSVKDWIEHAKEESMDEAVYLQKLGDELEKRILTEVNRRLKLDAVSESTSLSMKQLRSAKKISQRKLGALVKLSQSKVCNIENGKCSPKIDDVEKIAVTLGVAVNILIEALLVTRQEYLKKNKKL